MIDSQPDKVALLRGVNVGGVKVAMAELRALAEALGWHNVQTYIASGNLLFSGDGGAGVLEAAITGAIGRRVPVLVLTGAGLRAALATCPAPDAPGNHVHGFFCWEDPMIDTSALAALRSPTESLVARGRTVWLHAPDGIGRSVLAAKIGRVITGTAVTARNLNTVRALVARLA